MAEKRQVMVMVMHLVSIAQISPCIISFTLQSTTFKIENDIERHAAVLGAPPMFTHSIQPKYEIYINVT